MKNSRGISALLITLGIGYLFSLVIINFLVLDWLFKSISATDKSHIAAAQICLICTGLIHISIGFLGYQKKIFSFLDYKRLPTNITLCIILLISGFLFIEITLRIKPTPKTIELFKASIPYENSIFSRNKLPTEALDIPYLDDRGGTNYQLRQGYHGYEFSREKPDNEIRIVVLGGSFIFGDHHRPDKKEIESGYNHNWIQKIEQQLHTKGLKNVRFINAGIPGHASFDSFGRLYSEIHLFNPDYVVLCHGWNDIKKFPLISTTNTLLRQFNPKTKKSLGDVNDPLEVSQIYTRAKRIITPRGHKSEEETTDKKTSVITPEAKKQFILTTRLFVEACKGIGAIPILLTQPRLIELSNTESEKRKIQYKFQSLDHEGICKGYSFIDSVFLNYPTQDSVAFSHDFARTFIGVDSLYEDHVHLSAHGSEVLSVYLADYFERLISKNQ